MKKLKERWNIKSNFQLTIIFIVFAITGSTSAYLSRPVLEHIGINKENIPYALYLPLMLVMIMPIYQILLVFFGFVFGQFEFFWWFEKKMLRSMKLGFIADFFEQKFEKK
jgi:hypothetical protein